MSGKYNKENQEQETVMDRTPTANIAGEQSLIQSLARFVGSLSLDSVPERVRQEAKLCVLDTLGCILAGASLYKLPESRIAQAIAISGALANWGPAEVIFGDGGSTKPLQFGACPADGALRAGSYAENGLTGPLRLCESRVGWLTTFTNGYDQNLIRNNDTWYLLKPRDINGRQGCSRRLQGATRLGGQSPVR